MQDARCKMQATEPLSVIEHRTFSLVFPSRMVVDSASFILQYHASICGLHTHRSHVYDTYDTGTL